MDRDVYYLIDWGDDTYTVWDEPLSSDGEVTLSYTLGKRGTYIIKARAKDTKKLTGPLG